MLKRIFAFILCLTFLFGGALSARADVGALEPALMQWLGDVSSVHFSAALTLNTVMPFDETTLEMFNRVLAHVSVDSAVTENGEDSRTAARIAVDGAPLMDWSESFEGGRYALVTSLLPNRTLVSGQASPMETISAFPPESQSDTEASGEEDGINDSDVSQAFDMLTGLTEMQGCYQALTDGIKEYATEKKASYSIRNIGKATWSRIARLTTEQSEALLPELRALLSCGMDDAYRAEIEQMTFAKGFIVALYQDADGNDLSVYLKGTVKYPDETTRSLLCQWSFTTKDTQSKDIFKYEVSKKSGARDTRVIAASLTKDDKSDAYSIACDTKTTLKRARITDVYTGSTDLKGDIGQTGVMTCAGAVSRELAQTSKGDTEKTAQTVTVDVQLTPDGDGHALSGTANFQRTKDKDVLSDLTWTLEEGADQAVSANGDKTQTAEPDGVTVNSIDAATEEPTDTEEGGQVSSLEQLDSDMDSKASAFLVGSAPEGLAKYTAPNTEVTVDLDDTETAALQGLLTEAEQNLAGKLITAVAALPAEDAALLTDSMTDEDTAAFQSLLEALGND